MLPPKCNISVNFYSKKVYHSPAANRLFYLPPQKNYTIVCDSMRLIGDRDALVEDMEIMESAKQITQIQGLSSTIYLVCQAGD